MLKHFDNLIVVKLVIIQIIISNLKTGYNYKFYLDVYMFMFSFYQRMSSDDESIHWVVIT